MTAHPLRSDLTLISSLVPKGASVLDIGCGDGDLLAHLRDARDVRGFGLEIDAARVSGAVAQGLSVVQGDADTDLEEYPDDAFDIVILSNSLQALRHPDTAIQSALRIGKKAIVSFPNFGHWRVRAHLLLKGQMPISPALPYSWYQTTNIHLCTVQDFLILAKDLNVVIDQCFGLYSGQGPKAFSPSRPTLPNLSAEAALFVLTRP